MPTESQKRATAKYRQKCITKTVQFSPAESDMIEFLRDKPFATYVKKLIREQMKESR